MHINGVVREVNTRVLERVLELPQANGGRFEINLVIFVDDIALGADRWLVGWSRWIV